MGPWYVGETMKDLDKKFGKSRIIDSPVSENAVTGIAFGIINKSRPIVPHPKNGFHDIGFRSNSKSSRKMEIYDGW